MNILIIGSGAREHAIATALNRSKDKPQIFCCGTGINPGIKQMSHQYWVGDVTDVSAVTQSIRDWKIDLAIVGGEAPLAKGLSDALWEMSIPTIGPKQKLAQIETSKIFARELMAKYHIPGLPQFRQFNSLKGVESFLKELGDNNYVIKADGLMGGKGVKVASDHLHSINDALAYCNEIIEQDQAFLIEEKLIGQEFSLMCFCNGSTIIPMPIVQDHKRAFNDDKGPNTGGMGSYSDANHSLPFLTADDFNLALTIIKKTAEALSLELHDTYIGVLYGSFIVTEKGLFVIEFNARFGDPEALNVLAILETDFLKICRSLVAGSLLPEQVKFSELATVCKYAVPHGYPEKPIKDVPIDITAVKNKSYLYFASVDVVDGKIIAKGSRTAAYVGVATSIFAAEKISEREVSGIKGPLFHRDDIGTFKLIQKRIDEMRKFRDS